VHREPTAIAGCAVVELTHHHDERGEFVKVFQSSVTRAAGDDPDISELFWSRSRRGVVRGLHFQVPPHAHTKLVTIIAGQALDAVVDLRVGSPTHGTCVTVGLDAAAPVGVVVPIGCAHGFQALADDTVVLYATSTEHHPESDVGVRWDSAGIAWPIADATTSARDAAFPALADFVSPFAGTVD
jgi:dTDP-4-dehydrorhamnose 3,5-epimerase